MRDLTNLIKIKFIEFDITSQHLGQVIRDNNINRKRTQHDHFPVTRYKKSINKDEELDKFYTELKKYSLDKIINLDETSVQPAMIMEYSRCNLGERCIVQTNDNYIFHRFTLVAAINNKKCIGYTLYEKGGMTKTRLVEFLEKFIFSKYKNHLIILDNAGSHRNNYVKEAIVRSGNNYLFSVPYTPTTNGPIEMFFNQTKHYMKINKKVLRFNELQENIKNIIDKVKNIHYKNYYLYAYQKESLKLPNKSLSTLRRKSKNYKS